MARLCQCGGKKLAKLYGFGNTASRQIKAARQQNDQAEGIHTLFLNQTPNTGSESVTLGSSVSISSFCNKAFFRRIILAEVPKLYFCSTSLQLNPESTPSIIARMKSHHTDRM
ncbi:hypothetical protein L0N23_07200 [Bacteroides intestinalis]|uniref:hypothetical protein n=1 Tax=Bacteroides intestinalis TaxID=329854 RepID=UPI001D08BA64|nr:hypothetical protein [Bacteroides intestinalis]MCB6675473.1 hypothetical protein [Bacteroides intestinalis]MCB7012557.1 hypothetical protein [Bacteroides intestinalis]MCG4715717.1 hypothetical protein [Bacteroides intestinalis]MCG4736709.1 hypothetical protein [Bacteroides intestinalis]